MTKKLLLNLTNGVLLVSFCGMGKVIGAASRSPLGKGDVYLDERKAMRDLHFEKEAKSNDGKKKTVKPQKSDRSRSAEPMRKAKLPPKKAELLPPLPQELPKPEGIQVICNARVLEVYDSPDCCSNKLWQTMLDLTERIAEEQNWCDSKGAKNLVYYLARKYVKSGDQGEKDAIALYFLDTSGRYAGELVGGDGDDDEQEAIDFVRECLVNEDGASLFPKK